LALRREIVKKRQLITRVRVGKWERRNAAILNRLDESIRDDHGLRQTFEDPGKTPVQLVFNPHSPALAESLRIFNELTDIDIAVQRVICNQLPPARRPRRWKTCSAEHPGAPAAVRNAAGGANRPRRLPGCPPRNVRPVPAAAHPGPTTAAAP